MSPWGQRMFCMGLLSILIGSTHISECCCPCQFTGRMNNCTMGRDLRNFQTENWPLFSFKQEVAWMWAS